MDPATLIQLIKKYDGDFTRVFSVEAYPGEREEDEIYSHRRFFFRSC